METEDSVSDSEARTQWLDYDTAYQERWYLAVPVAAKTEAENLVERYGIKHGTVITWSRDSKGIHTFWGLPGI